MENEITKIPGAEIDIIQHMIDNKHRQVYWYGGRVAEVLYKGWTFILGAYGDVYATLLDKTQRTEIAEVRDKNNAGRFCEEMYRDIPDDETLIEYMRNGRLVFENNNWFEILVDGPDGYQYDTGWVTNSDDYIEALNEMLENMDLFIEENSENER